MAKINRRFTKINFLMFARRGLTVLTKTRPTMQLLAKQTALINMTATRSFSKFNSIESGGGKLMRALEKEIKYENDNYTQLEDIEQFLNESGFKFVEHDNNIKMSLRKQVGDKVVEVRFEAR